MITRNRKPRGTAGFKVRSVKAPYAGQDMSSVRRLTAILAADVAGYSRLMGADEEGTHERLKAISESWSIRRSWSTGAGS
jgi:class 3 adenylate cyclase